MKVLILNDHQIIPCGEIHATHAVTGGIHSNKHGKPLTVEFCKKLCIEDDRGDRYTKSSRYTYSTSLIDSDKGISLGAVAAVQMSIWEYYGKGFDYVSIENPAH